MRPPVPPLTGRPYLDDVRDQPGAVLALAHRGGVLHPAIEGLENTRAAFEHAASLGYHYLETDVHATADGVLLAFHDQALDRVSDATGEIQRLRHAEVRRARVGGREEIPTLASLLEALPGVRFNIDLKSDGAVAPLADLLAARRAWDDVLVGSFDQARSDRFRQLTGGRVATAATPAEVLSLLTLPLPVARRIARRYDALQVPERRRGVRVLSDRLIERAHAVGVHVHVWTVDEPARIRALLDRGVDGLFTDRTDVLREVLREEGRWWEAPSAAAHRGAARTGDVG